MVAAIARNRQGNGRVADSDEGNDQRNDRNASEPVHAHHIECMIKACALWHALRNGVPDVDARWQDMADLLDVRDGYRVDVAVAAARE